MHPEPRRIAFRAALPEHARPLAEYLLCAADAHHVSPFVFAAICDRESRFGKVLDKDGTGDHGHGRGLCQIDDRAHGDWVRVHQWRDPLTNLGKGAAVLAEAIAFFSLRVNRQGDPRPLAGEALMSAALAAYNAGCGRVLAALKANCPADSVTTGRDYSAWVLRRAAEFERAFSAALAA